MYDLVSEKPPSEIPILCNTDVTALRVSQEDALRWQLCAPRVYNRLVALSLRQQYDVRDLTKRCAYPKVRFICASYLFYLYEIYRDACYSQGYVGPVLILDTREEIARAVSHDVRTVNRGIKELQRQGLLQVERGKIRIDAQQAKQLSDCEELFFSSQ